MRNKTEKPERITISSIARDIGEKHLLCDQLEKLPKTVQVLEQVVESREAFAIRRIQWTMKSHIQERVHPRRWEFIKRAGVSTTQENPEVRKAIDDAIQKLNSLEFYGDEY